MATDPSQSPYYSKNPIFVQTSTPEAGSRLKRHPMLIVVAILVVLTAAGLGIWYFSSGGLQTSVFNGRSTTPFQQQTNPLLK